MNVTEETKKILAKYNIKANKQLGQNFLVNEEIIDKIISSSNINKKELIIEIGPGLGTLTEKLIDNAYKVIAIELDKKMVQIISDRFKEKNNIKIINKDILKVNLNELIKNEKNEALNKGEEIREVKVVANLPYYISTPIILKLLKDRIDIDSIIVMVQKEVAERLTAVPGNKLAGAITYAVNYYSDSSNIVNVGKESFIPSPKVESEVIKLNIKKSNNLIIDDEELFFDLIRKNFSQRRKTLVNILVNYKFVPNKEEAIKILNELDLSEYVRGETLTIEQYANLTNKILYMYSKNDRKML